MHQDPMDERIEENLELIWVLREEGVRSLARFTEVAPERSGERHSSEVFAELERRGLLAADGDTLTLTGEGEVAAGAVVRRHRLAERLLSDVLGIDEGTTARDACRLEHVLSPGVTESICTLLGHPPTCPHGCSIPRGECCRVFATEVLPLVVRLADLNVGEEAWVRFVSGRRDGIDRLMALGLAPGVEGRLTQQRPSYVVEVGETSIAIDGTLASAIFVKRSPRFVGGGPLGRR